MTSCHSLRATTGKVWLNSQLIRKEDKLKGCDAGINLGSQQQKKVKRVKAACIHWVSFGPHLGPSQLGPNWLPSVDPVEQSTSSTRGCVWLWRWGPQTNPKRDPIGSHWVPLGPRLGSSWSQFCPISVPFNPHLYYKRTSKAGTMCYIYIHIQ